MNQTKFTGFNTLAVHAGQQKEATTNALITPIYANSTFAHETPGEHKGYDYARFHNPTRSAFEQALVELENGKSAYAFASGMAAVATVLNLLDKDSHIIVSDDLYSGTYYLLERIKKNTTGLEVSYVDLTDISKIKESVRPNTKLIWVETPSNPLLKIIDLSAVAEFAKKNDLLTVADNTFASPFLQKPLDHGFDISLHSTTKYINGHSDMIGGAVVLADNGELAERFSFLHITLGAIPSPFDVFLAHRGLKTLPLRMKQHSENAFAVAEFLSKHPQVENTIYPGLKSHPQHELAKKQMRDFGGVVTITLKGGLEPARNFLNKLELFTLAVSLGGVESLIQSPALMTHSRVPKESREAIGLTDGLLRISVGIEDSDDLIKDLKTALGN